MNESHLILVSSSIANVSPNLNWIFAIYFEGNLANIFATIPINISMRLNVIENILLRAYCTPHEIAIYTALFK